MNMALNGGFKFKFLLEFRAKNLNYLKLYLVYPDIIPVRPDKGRSVHIRTYARAYSWDLRKKFFLIKFAG